MSFATIITRMAQAAVKGDGQAVADCFTKDGVYHDCFYGSFKGEAIIDMVENYFHRDGENFRWDLYDPIEQDGIGYARYLFSYDSKLPGAEDKRAVFEGICFCRIKNGKLDEYQEIANAVTGLYLLGFSPERLAKFIRRETETLLKRPESAAHIKS